MAIPYLLVDRRRRGRELICATAPATTRARESSYAGIRVAGLSPEGRKTVDVWKVAGVFPTTGC